MSDPTNDPQPQMTKRRRWVMPLLVASLALNLLVAGAIVGRELSPDGPRKHDRATGPLRSVLGEPFLRALDKDDRRALLEDLREEGPKIRETRKTLRTRFEAFLTAVRSEPFDRSQVEQLMKDQMETAQRRHVLGLSLLLNRLSEMDETARNAYADRLEENLKQLRRR